MLTVSMKSKLVNHPERKVWTWKFVGTLGTCNKDCLIDRGDMNGKVLVVGFKKKPWKEKSMDVLHIPYWLKQILDLISYPKKWLKLVGCEALTWFQIPAICSKLNKFNTFNESNLVNKLDYNNRDQIGVHCSKVQSIAAKVNQKQLEIFGKLVRCSRS